MNYTRLLALVALYTQALALCHKLDSLGPERRELDTRQDSAFDDCRQLCLTTLTACDVDDVACLCANDNITRIQSCLNCSALMVDASSHDQLTQLVDEVNSRCLPHIGSGAPSLTVPAFPSGTATSTSGSKSSRLTVLPTSTFDPSVTQSASLGGVTTSPSRVPPPRTADTDTTDSVSPTPTSGDDTVNPPPQVGSALGFKGVGSNTKMMTSVFGFGMTLCLVFL